MVEDKKKEAEKKEAKRKEARKKRIKGRFKKIGLKIAKKTTRGTLKVPKYKVKKVKFSQMLKTLG